MVMSDFEVWAVPTTTAWMETQSGLKFNPTEPEPSYALKDMMWGVARACRYAGQISEEVDHYSVAEHLVLLTRWAIDNLYAGLSPIDDLAPYQLQELRTLAMHDAQEGLLGDMTRPVKKVVPQFCALEDQFCAKFARRFDLIWPLPRWLNDLDSRILVDERRQVLNPSGNVWATDDLEPLGVTLQFWSPRVAFKKYRELLLELGVAEAI